MSQNNIVYMLKSMECDWDGDWITLGIFSTSNKAIDYVQENYYLLEEYDDICIKDFSITGEVFKQYGYDIHPSEIFEDEDGLFYLSQYDEDEPIIKEYVNTKKVFVVTGIKLDALIT